MTNRPRFPFAAWACAAALTLAASATSVADDYADENQARDAAAENYAARGDVREFVNAVADRHGFARADLLKLFAHARFQAPVIKFIMPPRDPGIRSWRSYRGRYIEPQRIRAGLRFWDEHEAILREAATRYGVPAEIIVAIIGVETIYGRMTGDFNTLSALATLAFDYPPRAELFRAELEELLLLARDKGRSALTYTGSFAGALGIAQFLPSSYRRYAVDFDGDGQVDLQDSPADAIGSVAHYLQQHGWQPGGRIAVAATTNGNGVQTLLDAGITPRFGRAEFETLGVSSEPPLRDDERAALIDLVAPNSPTEYWLGMQNFYVITRYNRSSFYAMAVFQLAETLRAARESRPIYGRE